MDIRTQSALLAAIVGLALGLSMLLRVGRTRVMWSYAVFAGAVSSYYLAHFLDRLADGSGAGWAARVTLGAIIVSGAFIPSAAIAFFLEWLGVHPSRVRRGRRIAFLSGFLGLAVGLTPLANALWAQVAVGIWVLGALIGAVSLLAHRVRQSDSRIERARLMYLAIGAGACIASAALDIVATGFDLPLPPFGPIFSALYLFFLAQTLLRLRLMDLHELLGKFVSQSVLTLALAAVFALLTAWVSNSFSLYVFNTVVAAFGVIVLIEPLRAKIEQQVIRILFRERFELLRALGGLKARLSSIIDVPVAVTAVLDALNETRRVTHASLYLLAEDRPGYRLFSRHGPDPAHFLDAAAARGLLNAAASGQKAVLLEHLERRMVELKTQEGKRVREDPKQEAKRVREEIKRLGDMRAAMQQMKAGITVPLLGNDRVIGFLNVWDERVPEAFASDEIALLLDISERLATVIENSKIYEKMRERDRLAVLGEMAAGLAHEIRNPLGAIKGAAQCLDPRQLPAEEREFVEVIVEEVNRLNGVVSAFLDYSRPLKQSFGATDLNEVVTRTVKLIQNDVPRNIELRTELADVPLRSEGDAEQLKQVLINLVQNGIQAIEGRPGVITLRTHKPERIGDFRGTSEACEVTVSDNGPGIPTDQQAHIFVPFFTTKQKGTGLGLAICQRIVKNHGGTIAVHSKVGEGSTFTIRLPALPSEAPAALLDSGTPFPGTLVAPTAERKPAVPAKAESRRDRKRRKSGTA